MVVTYETLFVTYFTYTIEYWKAVTFSYGIKSMMYVEYKNMFALQVYTCLV